MRAITEILKQIQPMSISELKYKGRIDEVTNRLVPYSMPGELIDRLVAKNFRWFVPVSFVSQFKYHATLLSPRSNDPCLRMGSIWSAEYPVFNGVIPETILDKIEMAKNTGIKVMTIHSMQPMPVEFVGCDPVVIGWHKNPRMEFHGETETLNLNSYEASLGVIVAVWDVEKEIELW